MGAFVDRYVMDIKIQSTTMHALQKLWKLWQSLPNNQAFPTQEHFAARYAHYTQSQRVAMYVLQML